MDSETIPNTQLENNVELAAAHGKDMLQNDAKT